MSVGPLESLKVVEWAGEIPGTYCGKLFADLGAEVIKVEAPVLGSPLRKVGPFPGDIPDLERSSLFVYLNNNKSGITLNLQSSAGQDIFRKLLGYASIFITDYPLSVLEDYHLTHQEVLTQYPMLIYALISPFGLSGPHASYKTSDLISFHMSGYGHSTPGNVEDPEQEPPLRAGGHQADYAAGLTAAVGAMYAIFTKLSTGRGQVVDVSRQEALISFNITNLGTYSFAGQVPVRHSGGRRSPVAMAANLPCKDGSVWFVVMADEQWERFVQVLGNPEWSTWEVFSDRFARADNWDALEPLLHDETKRFEKDKLVALCQEKKIPCLPANSISDVVNSPQLAARQFFREITHPTLGEITMPRNPLLFSGSPMSMGNPAPLLGEHNERVYKEVLGLRQEDLAALKEAGVI